MQEKKKRRAGRAIVVLAIVVAVVGSWPWRARGGTVAAYERHVPRSSPVHGLRSILGHGLDVTDEQRTHLDSFIETWEPRLTELTADAETRRAAIFDALRVDQPDTGRLHTLVDEQAAALSAVAHDLVDDVVAFVRTLSPEQREAIRAHWAARPEGARGRWRRGQHWSRGEG